MSNQLLRFTSKQLSSLNFFSKEMALDNVLGSSSRRSIARLIHEEGLKQHRVRQPLMDHDR
jgi:hypothetical protein